MYKNWKLNILPLMRRYGHAVPGMGTIGRRSIHYFLKEVNYADMERFFVELEIISRSFGNRCFDPRHHFRRCWDYAPEKHYLDNDLDLHDDRSMEVLEVEGFTAISDISSYGNYSCVDYGERRRELCGEPRREISILDKLNSNNIT